MTIVSEPSHFFFSNQSPRIHPSLHYPRRTANLRALDAQNEVLIQSSRAQAMAVEIQAQGQKVKAVLESEAQVCDSGTLVVVVINGGLYIILIS